MTSCRGVVILSAAKDLASLPRRSFAALRMTVGTPLQSARGKLLSKCLDKERFPLLVCMEHFLDWGPPLAGCPCLQGYLHRLSPGPPLERPGVRSHLRHIGLIIVADIFEIGKEQLTVTKNAVVANVAGVNHRQHFGPNGGMQTFVCFDLVRLQADDLSNPAHD